MAGRDYSEVLDLARGGPAMVPSTREAAMRRAVTLLWGAFGGRPLSWIGFYEKSAVAEEMVLVCREPKPACSPIGLHGMCGRCWKERRAVVIRDVATLGDEYIACDPRDRSELVVPVIAEDGSCWGVLDADSYDVGAFDEHDAAAAQDVLEAMGLSSPRAEHRRVLRL